MKILEVTEFEPLPGKEYSPESYPRNGVYLLPNGNLIFVVNNCTTTVCMAAYLVKDSSILTGQPAPAAAPQAAGITETTLLKALAIAQNPALAVQLTSEPT